MEVTVSEQGDSQTPALRHPSCSTKLRGRKISPLPSETTSPFIPSTVEGSLSGLRGVPRELRVLGTALLAGVSCALTGCFTSRLSFAGGASGHLGTQHKHVAARKCIRKTHCSHNQTPPGSHQSTTHTPRPARGVCGHIRASPRPGPDRARPWQGAALLYLRSLLGGWR